MCGKSRGGWGRKGRKTCKLRYGQVDVPSSFDAETGLQRVLCIKYVGAAVTFVKISSPQISAGTGLNVSHEQVPQCLSFAAKLGIGKRHFFPHQADYKRKPKLSAKTPGSILPPPGRMGRCSLWRPAPCVPSSEEGVVLLPKRLSPWLGRYQYFY